MKFKLTFTIFGKDFKMTIKADSSLNAKEKLKNWLFSQVSNLTIQNEVVQKPDFSKAEKIMKTLTKN